MEGKTGGFFKALSASAQIRQTYGLLGMFKKNASEYVAWYDKKHASAIPDEVIQIANERLEARKNKDWAKSDELRGELAKLGYLVKDSKDGYELIKNS